MISIPIPFIIDVRTGNSRIQLTPSKTDTNNPVTSCWSSYRVGWIYLKKIACPLALVKLILKFTRPEWSCMPTNPIFTNILFISSNLACLWDNLQTKHASWRFAPLVVGCQTVLLPCSVLREVVTGGSQEPIFGFFFQKVNCLHQIFYDLKICLN